jgi:flagellar hook-length control protein FliK
MIALPSQPALPVPNAPGGDTTAVLPAALLPQPDVAPTPQPVAVPRFDQTLQDLLHGLSRAPGAPTTDAPQLGDTEPTALDAALDRDDGAPTVPGFDPALTSLQTAAAPVAWQQAQAVLAQTMERATQNQAAAQPPDALVTGAATSPSQPQAHALPTALASALPTLPPVQAAPAAAMPEPAAAALPQASTAAPKPVAPVLAASTDTGATPAERAHASPVPALASLAPNAASEAVHAARGADAAAPARPPTLLEALAERIGVHTERGSERVLIRLDPPHRGQIDIQIRHDASGATLVTLTASHGDVVRQLHAIGDSLRQELALRQGGDVTVQIAQQSRDDDGRQQRQGQQQATQQQPGRALNDSADAGEAEQFALATDRT